MLFLRMLQKIGTFFSDHHAGDARIDADHGGEYGCICYSHAVNAFYAQLWVNYCPRIVALSHPIGACGMVHGISSPLRALRELLLVSYLTPRCAFSLYPSILRALCGD